MNNERIHKLLEFMEEDPNDPFPIYALALEYLNTQPTKSEEYFTQLLEQFPSYTGTYYHAAKYFAEIGETEKAEKIFLKGIEVCKNENDSHSLREIQTAYNEFLFENDDDI